VCVCVCVRACGYGLDIYSLVFLQIFLIDGVAYGKTVFISF